MHPARFLSTVEETVKEMDLKALVAQARDAVQERTTVDQTVPVGKVDVTFRFRALPGNEWRDLIAVHPPRDGAPTDLGNGYNMDAVVAAYPAVFTVDGDVVEPAEDFKSVCAVLSAPALEALTLAVWGLNVWEPQKQMGAVGKARAGKKRRSLPAS